MALNKNAVIRYQILDKCFSNPYRKFFIDDLIECCSQALMEYYGADKSISRRQVLEDINFMRSLNGYNAPIEGFRAGKKVYYRYEDVSFSINKSPITIHEAEELKAALIMLSRFKGLPQFEWMHELILKLQESFNLVKHNKVIISFDNNEYLKNNDFLAPLFQYILQEQPLQISYLPFQHEHATTFVFSPYHLKQYNNRWFLLGKKKGFDGVINLALDRIVTFESTVATFESADINFIDYFEEVIGVSKPTEALPQKILLKINKALWPYIHTKPLHGSQKLVEQRADFTLISIEVMVNYELKSLLFSFHDKIEILSPIALRQEFMETIIKMAERYMK